VGLVQFSAEGGGLESSPAFIITGAPTVPFAQAKVTFDVSSWRVMSLWPVVPSLPLKMQPVKIAFAPS
jgi:hypothetical protein